MKRFDVPGVAHSIKTIVLITFPQNSQMSYVIVFASWCIVLYLRIGKDRFGISVNMDIAVDGSSSWN